MSDSAKPRKKYKITGCPTPPYDAIKAVVDWCNSIDKCVNCPLNKNIGCYHPHEWPHIWENNNQEDKNND